MRCQPQYFKRRGEFIKSVASQQRQSPANSSMAILFFLFSFSVFLLTFCSEMAEIKKKNGPCVELCFLP